MVNEIDSLALVKFPLNFEEVLVHRLACAQLVDQKEVFFVLLVVKKFADVLSPWCFLHLGLKS